MAPPAAPLLQTVDKTNSLCVLWSASPTLTHVSLWMRQVGQTALIVAHNAIGASPDSPESDAAECEKDEVEVTGGRTWKERDAEARKRSLDVTEYNSPPPAEKQIKRDPSASLASQSQSSAPPRYAPLRFH